MLLLRRRNRRLEEVSDAETRIGASHRHKASREDAGVRVDLLPARKGNGRALGTHGEKS